jgi:multicomponent Na+:H+ antiporter subunit E
MSSPGDAAVRAAPRALARSARFLVLWLVLAGTDAADLAAGLAAAVAATWASLRLLPPGSARVSAPALAALALRFAYQSAIAGADVARRALDPRMPLRTGFVAYPVRFPAGPVRNAFATLTSLLPGTVPAGDENGQLVYHCLDIEAPVISQLAAEEAALSRALGHD